MQHGTGVTLFRGAVDIAPFYMKNVKSTGRASWLQGSAEMMLRFGGGGGVEDEGVTDCVNVAGSWDPDGG